ncbi:MAG: GntR family transcriptional regulator [Gemmataceae bacterium]|nr:GntR family transcriptional regulator [Gemmata sp.]MDW8199332.1 GntR family transcriptional regulator [Gemmataceae bacterium]
MLNLIEHDRTLCREFPPMQVTLSEKIYRELRRRVLAGELKPGTQIINRAFAQEMGVSLAPVREAIYRLATERLVELVPGAGAFVPQPSLQDLEELYVLRDAIESCAAAEAARNRTSGQLQALERTLITFEKILSVIRGEPSQLASDVILNRWLDCEEHFHRLIVEASRNRFLARVIDDHTALGRVFGVQRHRAAILNLPIAQETCHDHTNIVMALRDRDADTARRLMSEHIRKGCQRVLDYLRESNDLGHG